MSRIPSYSICADSGMAALQLFYRSASGLWESTGWWNGANALETLIDYCAITESVLYRGAIATTFEKHKGTRFLNEFYDDEGWWALTWIKAFDLTNEARYLEMARSIFKDMQGGWDSKCGGGIWWSKERQYKNAIANELFLAIAARLALRVPSERSYLDWAVRSWNWFRASGMINARSLINDGLDSACRNNGKTTWTYNQGVILGGLADLYRSTNDQSLLTQAKSIADAACSTLAPNGILREPCEPGDCGRDGPQFKGIFVRNLSYLYRTIEHEPYKTFILRNADSIWSRNRNPDNQFGLCWSGEFDQADAARQSSAIDVFNAAMLVSREKYSCSAETATLHDLVTETRFSSRRYIAGWNRDGQWADFVVTISVERNSEGTAAAGRYTLSFRYAAAGGEAIRYLFVNGKTVVNQLRFPATQGWEQWNTIAIENVPLIAGRNTIAIIFNSAKGSRNWLNLDEMTIR